MRSMSRPIKIAFLGFLWMHLLYPGILAHGSVANHSINELDSVNYEGWISKVKEIAESKPDSALDLTSKVLISIQKQNDRRLLAKLYVVRSIAYSYKAQYDSAMSNSFAALDLAKSLPDTLTILDAYNNLGIDFMYQEEYETSGSYFAELLSLAIVYKDTLRWAHALNNLGILSGYKQNYEDEVQYYEQASSLFEKINEMEGFANTLINIGTTQTAIGNYSEASKNYTEALEIYRDLGYVSAIVHTQMNFSENAFLSGNTREALTIAFSTLSLIKENQFDQDEIYLYELLKKIYQKENNYKRAFEYQKKGFELKEKIFNSEKSLQINELETKYQTSVKESEIEKLKLEKDLGSAQLSQTRWQMAFVIAGAISLVAFAIFLYWLKVKKVKTEQIEQQLRFEALQKRYMELLNGPAKVEFDLDIEEFNKKLFNPLTAREYDVLKLSMKGNTNQEIADQIFVSLSTIKFHMGNIYNKLGVSNKKEALEYVVKSS